MYGLVNRAVQELVETRFGVEEWKAIRVDAGIDVEMFVGMEQYPDEVTYRLVEAASRHLGLSPDAVMEAFGEYWVLYTGRSGYDDLMKMSGTTLVAFLHNLDTLHAHVSRSYPNLRPPSFQCTDVTEGSLLLHYRSHRPGLTPLVVGLIKGLGAMFNTPVRVAVVERKSAGADHDVFRVEYGLHA